MRRDIKDAAWFGAFLILMVLAVQSAGCGASARETTIRTTLATVDEACTGFRTYAHEHAMAIITKAVDGESARAGLTAWRAEEDKVFKYCDGAYRSVAVAAQVNDDKSVASLVAAAGILMDELRALKVIK